MRDAVRLALAVAAKDIRAELRSRTALVSALAFAALVLVVFNFARDPTAVTSVDLAPSALWVTFAFGAVIALNRAFNVEREHGAIDGLLLAPIPREALYAGKVLANLAFVGPGTSCGDKPPDVAAGLDDFYSQAFTITH